MKKFALAAALLFSSVAVWAGPFTIVPGTPAGTAFNINQFNAVNSVHNTPQKFLDFLATEGFSLSNAVFGDLYFNNTGNQTGTVTAEYFGKEAGFTNLFTFGDASSTGTLSTKTSVFDAVFGGDTISVDALPGNNEVLTLFSSVQTGNSQTSGVLFVLNSSGTQALGLFNDHGSSDRDFDDMVVRFKGLNGQGEPLITTPIPEPRTYALMIAGLAALGFVTARRRKV